MMKNKSLLKLSWIPYILILFEMFYMATPFAVFFYSIYGLPLKFLNESPKTAWMLLTVFPHFVETNSRFIDFILIGGWFFMLLGVVVFILAFIQIYHAKFAKKGAVTGGLYSIIRHPQYTAWTLFGLGMSIIWSRVIVWMMFVTMTFIYYFLAREEEKECSRKFPESYTPYLKKTGMFFPKLFNTSLSQNNRLALPIERRVLVAIFYITTLAITVFLAFWLRRYTISKMATHHGEDYSAVSLTYINPKLVKKVTEIVHDDPAVQKELSKLFSGDDRKILYVLPQNWSVSELGMDGASVTYSTHGRSPMARPSSHGNPKDIEPMKKRVVVSIARLISDKTDESVLQNLKQQIPKMYVDIDLQLEKVTDILTDLPKGIYGDIPVPVY